MIYRATHKELDDMYDKMMDSIRIACMLTMIWVHAHYQIESGKAELAEWFDVEAIGQGALWTIF